MKKLVLIILFFSISVSLLFAQQTLNETLFHDGQTRSYTVYVPVSYSANESTPLLFCFHGWTQTVNNFMNTADFRAVADTAGFIVVYPQGSLLNGNSHWNVGSWTSSSSADDVGFVEAIINRVSSNYNISADRIYATGYSNGGYFSFELACQLSEKIAAIGVVSGTMSTETYNACNPSHPTPVITIHGNADEMVQYDGSSPINSKSVAQVTDYWLSYNNIATEPSEETVLENINRNDGSTIKKFVYAAGDNNVSFEHYKVRNGSHAWPYMDGNPNTRNCDIDAHTEIWRFVSKYDINGLRVVPNEESERDTSVVEIYDTIQVFDTIIVQHTDTFLFLDTVTLLDTMITNLYDSIVVQVQDTLTVYDSVLVETVVNVYDTVVTAMIDSNTIMDTLIVYDTLRIFDSIIVLDSITVRDTVLVNICDTTSITAYDTIITNVYDTFQVEIVDTSYIEVLDTIMNIVNDTITFYDTVLVSIDDTLFINHIVTNIGGQAIGELVLFRLYPNPARSVLNIDVENFDVLEDYFIDVFNSLGVLVVRRSVSGPNLQLDISSFNPGSYYFNIRNGSDIQVTKTIIISHF